MDTDNPSEVEGLIPLVYADLPGRGLDGGLRPAGDRRAVQVGGKGFAAMGPTFAGVFK